MYGKLDLAPKKYLNSSINFLRNRDMAIHLGIILPSAGGLLGAIGLLFLTNIDYVVYGLGFELLGILVAIVAVFVSIQESELILKHESQDSEIPE
jgi:hypothetical protein